jgi:L-fuculose-phosphate aldolase
MNELERIALEMSTYSDMLVNQGLLHLKGGNLSARLVEDLVITRTRSLKEDIVAEKLIVAPIFTDEPVDNASSTLSMHRAIYRKTSAKAILHAHPYHPTLLSYYRDGFSPLDENGLIYLGKFVPSVTAPGFMAWEEIDEAMADALATCPAAILRWHGVFTIGTSLAEAFHYIQAVETAARFAYDLLRQEGKLGQPDFPHYVEAP